MLRRIAVLTALVGSFAASFAQSTAGLEGQIMDPSGAAVPGVSVHVTGSNGTVRTSLSDNQGRYRIDGLSSGTNRVRVVANGFALFESENLDISADRIQTFNVRLQIQQEKQNITVSDTASQVGVDPSQSVGQIVLRGSDLDAFSDDPEDLANDLQLLAGPSPGPDGGQIFIDGFSGGIMPPKASIREIRVNHNPFSAEYDRVGFGRVEVLTK